MILNSWSRKRFTVTVGTLVIWASLLPIHPAIAQESEELTIRQTGITDFDCEVDKNGLPTVFVRTQRTKMPVLTWAYSERSLREAQSQCRQVAIKFQQFYNCKILDTLKVSSSEIFVTANPDTRRDCPALKPDRAGKLQLLPLEPGADAEKIDEQLYDIQAAYETNKPVCIRDKYPPASELTPAQENECRPIAIAAPRSIPLAPPILEPITSVSELSDVDPTDWAYKALKSLIERYGVIKGYPDRTFRGHRAMTRYEFAEALAAALDRMKEILDTTASSLVSQEDLLKFQQLQTQFAPELAEFRNRVNTLEDRTATLEKQQFSTTTKLFGEAVFALTNTSGQDISNQTTFQNRIRLELQTSFTGQDVLHTRLTAGNTIAAFKPDNTAEGTQQFAIGNTGNNQIQIDWLSYLLPINNDLYVYVAGVGGKHSDYVYSTFNPYLQDYDGGAGALSAFGQESPIYRIGGGAGVALNYKFLDNDALTFTLGYLAGPSAGSPLEKNGLFNGNHAFLWQATVGASERFQFGLTYVHAYHTSGTPIFNQGSQENQFYVGSTLANAHFGQPVSTDSIGIQAAFKVSPKLSISGFLGYTEFSLGNRKNEEIWYYGLNLAFPDLGRRGNLGGITIGVEPYIASQTRIIPRDVSLHLGAFYRHQLTDSIYITPGIVWISAPNQNADNHSFLIATLRLTFKF